jgi:hypothetical protein
MALNFPDNPSNGDTYSFGGKTYTYNSTKSSWSPSMDLLVPIYATANDLPSSGSAGSQAFVTATNRLYIWNGSGWYNIALINTSPTISGVNSNYDLASDGTATVITITATDPEGLPITYSIASDTSGNIATVTQGTGANTNVFTITPSTNSANGGTFSLTFRASDGVNIATAPASFTLQFTVNNSNYTTALITSVGGNNAVNDSFVDSSSSSQTVTTGGTVFTNAFSPYRQGGYSTYFDGSGDYIRYQDASLAEGTDDFTVEFWVYRDGTQSLNDTVVGHDTTPGYQICFNSDGSTLRFMRDGTDASRVLPASLNDQQWHHVVYQRDSGTLQGFLDGVSLGTASVSTNFTNNIIEIGVNRGGTAYFTGNVRDVRIIKGTAFYSSSGFDVPTEPLTAVSGTGYSTTLLSCHLPYIADGGANSLSPTVNGNTKTEPFAPYDYGPYSTSTAGGSAFFNENTNNGYLRVDAALDGATSTSSPCTIECWLYTDDTSPYDTYGSIFGINRASDGNNQAFFSIHTGGTYYFHYSGNAAASTGDSVRYNQWEHLAFVFNDGSSNVFKWYRNGKLIYETTEALDTPLSDCTFLIGAEADAANAGSLGNYLKGHLSEVRVSNVARYTAEFTPPTQVFTSDSDTSLLLHFNDGAIIDKSQSVQTLTLNGNVSSSTTQSKYLSSSMYFDPAATSQVNFIDISGFDGDFSTGDFTIEGWIWPASLDTSYSLSSQAPILDLNSSQGTAGDWWVVHQNNSSIVFGTNQAVQHAGASNSLTASAWHHFAIARASGTLRIFVDGTETGSSVSYAAAIGSKRTLRIAGQNGTARWWEGYLSDVRITKGLARYTANFTPPTAELKG